MGAYESPAQDEQCDGHNHKDLTGNADEDAAPDSKDLRTDVPGVIHDDDSANDVFVGGMKRCCQKVDTGEVKTGEPGLGTILRESF